MSKGAPADKLVVGMAFFGKTWTPMSSIATGVGDPKIAVGAKGPHTDQPGLLAYYEVGPTTFHAQCACHQLSSFPPD